MQEQIYAKTPWATRRPSTLSHPCPPTRGPAQILHQNTEGDLECVSGGGGKAPHQADSRHPSVFWWRIWAGPGGGGAWVTERRWVRGCPGCLSGQWIVTRTRLGNLDPARTIAQLPKSHPATCLAW